jgi:hypothetical protein
MAVVSADPASAPPVCDTVRRIAVCAVVVPRSRSSRNLEVTWIVNGTPIPIDSAARVAVTGLSGMPVSAIVPKVSASTSPTGQHGDDPDQRLALGDREVHDEQRHRRAERDQQRHDLRVLDVLADAGLDDLLGGRVDLDARVGLDRREGLLQVRARAPRAAWPALVRR